MGRRQQPAEAAALEEVLVYQTPGEETETCTHAKAVFFLRFLTESGGQCAEGGAADYHRPRHDSRARGGAGDEPAGRVAAANAGERGGFLTLLDQAFHDTGLVAAAEEDAAVIGESIDHGRVECGGFTVLPEQGNQLRLHAVAAEIVHQLLAHFEGISGGHGEHRDAPSGVGLERFEQRPVVAFEAAPDHQQWALLLRGL